MIGEDKIRIVATVTKEMKKELEKIAESESRSVSNLISVVLKDFVDNYKKTN